MKGNNLIPSRSNHTNNEIEAKETKIVNNKIKSKVYQADNQT